MSRPGGHVFISYVREDSHRVDDLQGILEAAGISIWRDSADLWPGQDWRANIRRAITGNALVFVACFSEAGLRRDRSFQNEELRLAIEQLRQRRPDTPWLIPVRFDECAVPDLDLGGGRTLASIQGADLFGARSAENAARLVTAIRRILDGGTPALADGTTPQRRHMLSAVPWQGQGGAGVMFPEARGDDGRYVSLPPRPVLAGRDDLLAAVSGRMRPAGSGLPRIVALHGLGGAGKTCLAVEHAHRCLPGTSIAWLFPAEHPDALGAEFTRLAALLGAGQGASGLRDPVAVVHSVLASHRSRWVLIFDNAPDQYAIRRFLPPAGDGQVVITSQNPAWPHGQALEVPVLSTEDAARYLTARTSDPDQDAAVMLAGDLGGLPLALEQAASYINASGSTLGRYRRLFRQRSADLLARGEPEGHARTTARTWALAFAEVEQRSPAAGALMRLVACCAPEPVPLELLLSTHPQPPDPPVSAICAPAPVPGLGTTRGASLAGDLEPAIAQMLLPMLEDPLAAGDAVAALRRYSLISLPGPGQVLMHRLVQAVTVDHLPGELARQWRKAAAALVQAALPADVSLPQSWPDCAALLPHARALLPYHSPAMADLANYLGFAGGGTAALTMWQKVAGAQERELGREHPDTLWARYNVAWYTGETGDTSAARDQHAALLPVLERVHGRAHRQTLSARRNLALWTGRAGDLPAARTQYTALLHDREQLLGKYHLETALTRRDLTYLIGEESSASQARDLSAAALRDCEQSLGPRHEITLDARHDLAHWTGHAGNPAAARDQFAALAADRHSAQGPAHPDTLAARASLASWTGTAGNADNARNLYAALLPDITSVLGPDHPRTLAIRLDLARWTGQAGDPHTARDLTAALIPDYNRVLGPHHPHTQALLTEHAHWTGPAPPQNPAS